MVEQYKIDFIVHKTNPGRSDSKKSMGKLFQQHNIAKANEAS